MDVEALDRRFGIDVQNPFAVAAALWEQHQVGNITQDEILEELESVANQIGHDYYDLLTGYISRNLQALFGI